MIIITVYKLKCIKTFFTDLRTEIEWTSRRVYEIHRLSTQKKLFSTLRIQLWENDDDVDENELSTYIRMCSIVIFIYNCQQQWEREHTYRAWKKNTQKTHFRKKRTFHIYTSNANAEGKGRENCENGWKKRQLPPAPNFNPSQQSKSTFYIKISFTYILFFSTIFFSLFFLSFFPRRLVCCLLSTDESNSETR